MTVSLFELAAAFLVPPFAVWLKIGFATHFWINVILTLLGYLPGVIHALWVIFTF